jgi:hypothetical protein
MRLSAGRGEKEKPHAAAENRVAWEPEGVPGERLITKQLLQKGLRKSMEMSWKLVKKAGGPPGTLEKYAGKWTETPWKPRANSTNAARHYRLGTPSEGRART